MQIKYWPVLGLLMPLVIQGQELSSGVTARAPVQHMERSVPIQRQRAEASAVVASSALVSGANTAMTSFSGPGGYSAAITFSEYPEGTDVSTSYRAQGVLFGGTGPTVVRDTASFGAQVLSGGPDLTGDITGSFVLPGTDTPAPVYRLGFDIGSIEGSDSVRLDFYDETGQVISSYHAPSGGFFRIGQNGGNLGIYAWSATVIGNEPDGYGIDNLYFSEPGVRDDLDREKGETPVCAGNPVNPAVGNKYQEEVDYEGAGPFPLRVARSYNSLDGRWRFFPEILHDGASVAVQAVRPSGKGLTYLGWGLAGGSSLMPSALNITGELSADVGVWRYASLDGTVEIYDPAGRIVSVTNRAGIRHSYIYAEDSITVSHSFGASLVYQLDQSGRISGFTDPAGQNYGYGYNSQGMITSVSYPGGTARAYHYEDLANPDLLTGISDANGDRHATWQYDADRRAISSTHHGGADLTGFDYSRVEEDFPSVSVTNALGRETQYLYAVVNGQRLPLEVNGQASPNCVASSQYYGYDGRAFVRSRRDWEGNLTEYLRDNKGRELVRTEAVGTTEQRTIQTSWHPELSLPVRIDEAGRTTINTYDVSGNLLNTRVIDTTAP